MTRYIFTPSILRRIMVLTVGLVLTLIGALIWSWQILPRAGPEWRGIKVGESTSRDVVALLGEPDHIERHLFDMDYLYSGGAPDPWLYRIVISQDIVQVVEENTLQQSDNVLLTDLIDKFGQPSLIEWSKKYADRNVIVYPRIGILAEVVALPLPEAYMTTIIYFRPRTDLRVTVDFFDWLSDDDPFPTSDIVARKDPWFGTSGDCRIRCNDQ